MMNQEWIINLVGRGNYCDGFLVKLEDFLSKIQDPTDDADFFSPYQWKHITQIEEAAVALKGAIASALEDGLHDERAPRRTHKSGVPPGGPSKILLSWVANLGR